MFAIGPSAFALLSAICYGAGDFMGGRASIRLPIPTTMLIAQVAACSIALATVGGLPIGAPREALLFGAIAGLCHVAAVGFLYYGLAHGRVCVIAPVSGITNIALPVLVDGIVINDLGLIHSVGILMAAAAVGLVSCCGLPGSALRQRRPRHDLLCGAVSGVLFGVADLAIGSVTPEAGGDAVLAARLVGLAGAALAVLAVNRRSIASALTQPTAAFAAVTSGKFLPVVRTGFVPETRAGIALALLAGIGDCLGHFSFTMAAATGELSVAVATSAMFPAVSVLLAILLLKERVSRAQSIGLAVSAGSVMLLAGT